MSSKQMPWFRMYSDFIYDDKVEFLSFEDQRHYVFILCMKNLGLLDKEYPKPGMLDRVVAKRLGLYGEAFEAAKARLVESELIDDQFQPLAWDKRQYLSDSSTERVRAYRERMKAKRTGNVSVTAQDTDTDTDTEEETDKEQHTPPAQAQPEVREMAAASQPASGYPEVFELTWACYPKRPGANKRAAFKAWNARVNAGVDPNDIIAGVQRYAKYCDATKTTGTRYVKQPETFFGPDEHFEQQWEAPAQTGTTGKTGARHGNFGSQDYHAGLGPDGAF